MHETRIGNTNFRQRVDQIFQKTLHTTGDGWEKFTDVQHMRGFWLLHWRVRFQALIL